MNQNPILKTAIASALIAILVVVVLKFIGYENPTVIGGGIAGGVAGAIISTFFKKSTVK